MASADSDDLKKTFGVPQSILLDVYCKAVQDALLEVNPGKHADTSSLLAFTLYIVGEFLRLHSV